MLKKWIYLSVGGLSLLLGIVGIFLPLLPATPFLLLSAFCFSQGHPGLHAWLLNHRLLGPPLVDWEKNRVIRPRSKFVALCMIAIGVATVWLRLTPDRFAIQLAVTAIMFGVAIFILTRKSEVESKPQRK